MSAIILTKIMNIQDLSLPNLTAFNKDLCSVVSCDEKITRHMPLHLSPSSMANSHSDSVVSPQLEYMYHRNLRGLY